MSDGKELLDKLSVICFLKEAIYRPQGAPTRISRVTEIT